MSRVRIHHLTRYEYHKPVTFGPHRLILRPREGHDLLVEEQQIRTDPISRITWHRDLFGNSVAYATFPDGGDHLEIVNTVLIRRRDFEHHTDLRKIEGFRFPVTYSSIETPAAKAYQEPVYKEEAATLKSWVQQTFDGSEGGNATRVVDDMMRWIQESVYYRRREDRGVQTPLETLNLKSGSCRDKATLFLEALRTLGFAGRFASGYLDSNSNDAGKTSTHAWLEVYLPDLGWIGCDPTIGEYSSSKHIVLGVSAHPRGVMPISGAYSGPPEHYEGMSVSVDVESIPVDDLPGTPSPKVEMEISA